MPKSISYPPLLLGITICTIGALFYCYEFILRATPGIMVHELMNSYVASAETIGILSTCYYYLYTPLQLPAGILMDKYGPRVLLGGSVIFCTLGALLMYFGIDIRVGYGAQLIIGAGSAFAFVGALKLASNWLPEKHFALFSGITTTLGMIGAVSTDIFLIKLVSTVGWQVVWLVLGLAGIAISLMMFTLVKDGPERSGLAHHRTHKVKREHKSWTEFYRALKLIVANRVFWVNSLIGGILFLPFTVIGTLWGVLFLMDAHHYSHEQAGLGTSMLFLGMAFGGPIAGWFSEKIKNRLLLIRLSCLAAALLSSLLIYSDEITFQSLCILMFAYGFVLGAEVLVFPVSTDLVDKKFAGTSVAATNFMLMLWGVFIQPIVGRILDYRWDGTMQDGHTVFSFMDYQYAFLVLPVSCVVAFLLSFLMKRQTIPQSA